MVTRVLNFKEFSSSPNLNTSNKQNYFEQTQGANHPILLTDKFEHTKKITQVTFTGHGPTTTRNLEALYKMSDAMGELCSSEDIKSLTSGLNAEQVEQTIKAMRELLGLTCRTALNGPVGIEHKVKIARAMGASDKAGYTAKLETLKEIASEKDLRLRPDQIADIVVSASPKNRLGMLKRLKEWGPHLYFENLRGRSDRLTEILTSPERRNITAEVRKFLLGPVNCSHRERMKLKHSSSGTALQ